MTGIFWTALGFAALGPVAIVAAAIRANRKGGMDAAGIFITGLAALTICEAIAVVLAVVGFFV